MEQRVISPSCGTRFSTRSPCVYIFQRLRKKLLFMRQKGPCKTFEMKMTKTWSVISLALPKSTNEKEGRQK